MHFFTSHFLLDRSCSLCVASSVCCYNLASTLQAFYLARTGRPGPVLVDVPKDVQQQLAVPDWEVPMAISGYISRMPQDPEPRQVADVIQALREVRQQAGAADLSRPRLHAANRAHHASYSTKQWSTTLPSMLLLLCCGGHCQYVKRLCRSVTRSKR